MRIRRALAVATPTAALGTGLTTATDSAHISDAVDDSYRGAGT